MHTELKLTMKSRNTVSPSKGPSHHHLIPFAGHWKTDGKSARKNASKNELSNEVSKDEDVSGEEILEWMEGDFFLINRWYRKTISSTLKGLGWIGFDKATGAYLSYSVANTGYLRIYEVEVYESKIKFQAEHERGILLLNSEQNTLSIFWEQSTDGMNWTMLCNLMGHRIS